MFWFYVKKNFCNLWDDLFAVFVPGLTMSLCAALCLFCVYACGVAQQSYGALAIAFVVASGVFFGTVFAFGGNALALASWEIAPVKGFFAGFRKDFVPGFAFGALAALLVLVLSLAIPYYLKVVKQAVGSFALVIAGALFWFGIIAFLALQWFLPLHKLMPADGFFKTLRKCLIIFFDNAGFSVAVFLHNCALFVFSLLIFSAPAVVALSLTNALRLRLYKYDWLETLPESASKDERAEVPWSALLKEDRDTLGPRSLRSFIFPWK